MASVASCQSMHRIEMAIEALDASQEKLRSQFGGKLQSVLGARVDFDDFLQDVRVSIVKGVGLMKAQTDDEMSGWVFAVARNVYKDLLTRHLAQKRNARLDLLEEDQSFVVVANCDEEDVSWMVELLEQTEIVKQALERLPLNQARAVRMQYFGLLNSTEVAEALDITVGAARSLVCRALAAIRTELRKEVHLFDLEIGEVRSITAVPYNTAEVDYITDKEVMSNFLELNGDIKVSRRDSHYVSAGPIKGRFSCISVALKSA